LRKNIKLVLPHFDKFEISIEDVKLRKEFNYGENDHMLRIFILTYVKFLSDSPLESSSRKPLKVYKKFFYELINKPIVDTIRRFSKLSDELLRNSYSTEDGSTIRPFISGMIDTPIFREYHEWQKSGDAKILTYVLSFLRFGKKLSYKDESLKATAFREWLDIENGLRDQVFSDNDISSLRVIIKELIRSLKIDFYLPKFGSGKVSEKYIEDVYDKLEYLSTHPRLDYAFGRPNQFTGSGLGFMPRPMGQKDDFHSISRLIMVDKDLFKSRSICAEPNSFMYAQQDLHRWIRNSMEDAPIGNFVNITDQASNQRAALHGSKYHSCDTIDLSSASDSVNIRLVKSIFPIDWLFFMLASRSSSVQLPDESIHKLEKFAPMGSAICFPTQCIIFTAICIYCYDAYLHGVTSGERIVTSEDVVIIVNNFLSDHSSHSPFGQRLEKPLVYGDDIICDTRVTSDVITTLSRLGFRVNVSKSFTDVQSIRESCGVYAYEGEDVTPIIFRLPFLTGRRLDASQYSSLIEMINNFGSFEYYSTRTFLIELLRCYLGKQFPLIPYVTNRDDFGIYVADHKAVDISLLRYNSDYQIIERKVLVIAPRRKKRSKPYNLESYSYEQWMRSRIEDYSTPLIQGRSSIRPQETRVVPGWARYES